MRSPSQSRVLEVANQATQVECLVKDKDAAIHRLHLDRERQFSQLADGTTELANSLQMHGVARQHLRDEVSSKLREMQEHTNAGILQERRGRQDMEVRLERAGEGAADDVRACLAEEAKLQAESQRYNEQVRDEICNLYSDLERERQLRMEAGQKLGEGVKVKLGEIREALVAEQRFRVESQSTLLELFGKMGKTLDEELESARSERSEATERFICMMERVLPRMDNMWRKGLDACREALPEHGQAKDMACAASLKYQSQLKRSEVQMKRGSASFHGSLAVV
uniref:Uncharacterized protein n=1 Tax=Alexandrium monilatum TaxID=311494 RepID=A0A7S4SEY6_9DINO|mmetsp:Transcript_71830/g.214448  ORF Transcript_71830/g.214448 Transcript_71830/m.214448 type:complete len:282 (+) Transcript_71830:93-938(+)